MASPVPGILGDLALGEDAGGAPQESLLESSPISVMVVCTRTNQVIWANRRARHLFGLPENGERPVLAVDLWADRRQREQLLQQLDREGCAAGVAEFVRPDGTRISATVNWQTRPGAEHEVVCWATDATESARAQRRFQLQERMLETFFWLLPVAVFCKDVKNDFRYTHANPKCEQLFGFPARDYMGRTDFDMCPEVDATRYRATDLLAMQHGIYEIPDERYLRADGKEIVVRTIKVMIPDDEGQPDLLLGISEDITRNREVELALHASERRFRELAEHAPVGIFATDPEGVCVFANACWQVMSGRDAAESLGFGWQSALHPEDRREVTGRWQAFVRHHEAFNPEFRFLKPDGSVTWVAAQAVPLTNEAGQCVGHLASLVDITERRDIEQKLRQTTAEAERASYAKSEFLSRMSHELRTPLNAILGFGQLLDLERETLSREQREGVDHILQSGELLLDLIEDILDLSRIESGHISFSFKAISLDRMLSQSITMVGPMAAEQEISVSRLASPAPEVIGDERRLQQVLVNLLTNAIKYNRPGGSVRVHTAHRPEGRVRINIVDDGIGIRVEDQARLFEPFERAPDVQNLISGTGIGLSIAKLLVTLMGGDIGFESEFGSGSTFWIEIPVALGPHSDEIGNGGERQLPSFEHCASMRLLYIEDHLASLSFMQETVRRMPGSELRTALNAKDGLVLAREFAPDVILLDLNLPGMDGWEALERLRQDARTRGIPVIALSASTSSETIERGLSAGFSHFLRKPLRIENLLAALDSVSRDLTSKRSAD